MFDLPTTTLAEKRAYVKFRKTLLKDGFSMLQFSIYVRHCATYENSEVHTSRIQNSLPLHGVINVITITDKQYSGMLTYWGKKQQTNKASPAQLELF